MFQNYYPPKMPKLCQQIEFTTKHCMFDYKFYPNSENFTPSRMVWMVTFSKSVQRRLNWQIARTQEVYSCNPNERTKSCVTINSKENKVKGKIWYDNSCICVCCLDAMKIYEQHMF